MASGFCGTGQSRERLQVVVLFSVLGLPWGLAGVRSRIPAQGHLRTENNYPPPTRKYQG